MSNELVSSDPGKPLKLYGSRNGATANLRIVNHRNYRYHRTRTLRNATSVDAIMRRHSLPRLDVLKTDTEGCEWEVLQGASAALTTGSVRVIIVAYEDKWSSSTIYAAHPSNAHHAVSNVSSMEPPTLRSVTRYLEDFGYESFLLGSMDSTSKPNVSHQVRKVQMIPLTHGCWDDSFELARDPHALGVPYSWFDFVAVLENSPESQFIHGMIAAQAAE